MSEKLKEFIEEKMALINKDKDNFQRLQRESEFLDLALKKELTEDLGAFLKKVSYRSFLDVSLKSFPIFKINGKLVFFRGTYYGQELFFNRIHYLSQLKKYCVDLTHADFTVKNKLKKNLYASTSYCYFYFCENIELATNEDIKKFTGNG